MFTPQQIDQISFGRSTFGGYDMQQVDEFLEPLTEDYVTLYKENALLKSKMRVLVGKLEEYRKNEANTKEAVANTQRACDKMMREAEAKCAMMMKNASAAAAAAPVAPVAVPAAPAENKNTDALVAAENARVDEARRVAVSRITEIQDQMRTCVQALERIKEANAAPGAAARTARAAAPVAPVAPAAPAAPAPEAPAVPAAPAAPAPAAAPEVSHSVDSGLVAEEIAQNLEALVGTTEDHAPKAAPRHPVSDSTTSKFASLNLQFGRNYDPSRK